MQKGKSAFTLIELMIVIVLIGIIFLMFGNMNLNYMGDKQKAEQFANKIISEIETVRNNALVGRGIKDSSGNMIIPKGWTIGIFSKSISNYETKRRIEVRYFTDDVSVFNISNITDFRQLNGNTFTTWIEPDANKTIMFNCSTESNSYEDMFLTMKGNEILKDTTCKSSKLEIITAYKNTHKYKILFDPVTGLVTKELIN